MNRKRLIIISVGLLLLIIAGIWYFSVTRFLPVNNDSTDNQINNTEATAAPVFMTTEEKASLYLPVDTRIQVLNRDADGQALIYKIIKDDTDIVVPGSLPSFRPAAVE